MLKYIAVRLKRFSDGNFAFRTTKKFERKIVDSNIGQRDLAIKNISDGLHERGLEYFVDGCKLYWFAIDDDNTLEFYEKLNEVECVLDAEWFEAEKKRIRSYRGSQYVEACFSLVKDVVIKDQTRPINYKISKIQTAA